MRPLLGTAAAALLLAGCTFAGTDRQTTSSSAGVMSPADTAPSSSAGRSPGTLTLSCVGPITGDPPPAGFEVVLGAVALPTSTGASALGAADSGDPATPRLFAKTGLVVRAGTPMELEVTAQPGDRAAIGWTNGSFTLARRVVVPPCPDAFGTGWATYPGGYWVDRPQCLPLSVRAGGRAQQVRIGVGTPCPGQRPPAS